MKTNYLLLSLVLLMCLACSCSRQVTSLNSSNQLQAVSAPLVKLVSSPAIAPTRSGAIEPSKLLSIITKESVQSSINVKPACALVKETKFHKIVKKTSETIVKVALIQPGDMTFLQKPTTDRGYPQINKAGFIFIAAGILGFFLKLLPVACWICIGIGVIVLLSPLLRKRY